MASPVSAPGLVAFMQDLQVVGVGVANLAEDHAPLAARHCFPAGSTSGPRGRRPRRRPCPRRDARGEEIDEADAQSVQNFAQGCDGRAGLVLLDGRDQAMRHAGACGKLALGEAGLLRISLRRPPTSKSLPSMCGRSLLRQHSCLAFSRLLKILSDDTHRPSIRRMRPEETPRCRRTQPCDPSARGPFRRGVATKGIYATRAENATLWDADGKEYIDFAAGIAVVNTGHRHPAVMPR